MLVYACSPERGSECAVGWNLVQQIARHSDAWVICQDGEQGAEVRRYLHTHGDIPGLHFHFVPKRPLVQWLMRLPATYYLGYNLWHRAAYRVAQRLQSEVGFELVHQANLAGYREPGYLGKLGLPFIWGPWGGTSNYPGRFLAEAGWSGGLKEATRSLLNRLQLFTSRRVRQAGQQAEVVLASNSSSQRDFAQAHQITPLLLPANGITRVAAPRHRRMHPEGLRILWSGRLEAIKALSLLLKALARMPADWPCQVRILGSGPCGKRWRRLAERLGVQHRLQWLSWVPHKEALEQYHWADMLAFTSLRDNCPTVVLEALAAGLPVVCLDHQGMADIVTENCGIKIPVTTPTEVTDRLAKAILELDNDSNRWERLSQGAVERARDYLWPNLGERMAAIYRGVLAKVTNHQ